MMAFLNILWHPLGVCPHDAAYAACRSYNLFSGIGSDLSEITLLGLLVGLYAKHRCFHCRRIARFQVGDHRVPVCHRHRESTTSTVPVKRGAHDEQS